MTYNILNGLCNESSPYKIQRNRLKILSSVIEKENPDVLVLCEAFLWPFAKKNSLKDMSKIFGSLYNFYASADYNFRWAPIVLSKFPIEEFDTSFTKTSLNYLRTELRIGGKLITLDVFHPNPKISEIEKSRFLKPLLQSAPGNYIIAGDLNSLSPQDKYDKKKLTRGYVEFMNGRGKAKVRDMLTCKTIESILDEDLIDVYKKINDKTDFTMPTDLRCKNKDSAVRLDYIFCSNGFEIVDSGIVKNKSTEKASDHYPVYAVLDIK
jgi:endonuclease/exonuclease/phosphatase family metal-dependent hydrolase